MVEKMISNLEEKTGKKLAEWVDIVNKSGEEKHMAKIKFLKENHGLTHGYANLIVHTAKEGKVPGLDKNETSSDALVDAQYEKKPDLKPIYDKLVAALSKFGTDVEVAPKKAYVSMRRKKQFAIIQPSTKTRVDVGINLKGKEASDRLESSGSFNSMVSHRVRISNAKEVNKELLGWLKEAYQNAG